VSGIDKIFALHEPKPTNQLKINMIPLWPNLLGLTDCILMAILFLIKVKECKIIETMPLPRYVWHIVCATHCISKA
jgi:hypothetical protein